MAYRHLSQDKILLEWIGPCRSALHYNRLDRRVISLAHCAEVSAFGAKTLGLHPLPPLDAIYTQLANDRVVLCIQLLSVIH